jgi:hypothetical protein
MGIKNTEFDADFESVDKVRKNKLLKKLEGLELLPKALKDEKPQRS